MEQNNFPKIRPVTLADCEMTVAFFDQMGGETRALFDRVGGNRKAMLSCFDTPNPNRRNFIAVESLPDGTEQIAGLVFLWQLNTRTPWLGIAVAENWKGKHLGRELIGFAKDYCLRLNKGGIFLTTHMANVRGQALYAKCGFEYMGTEKYGELLYFHSFPDEVPSEDGTI